MPLGQRVAHMRPEGRLRIRDLRGELLVGARDGLPRGESGEDPCSSFRRVRGRLGGRCWPSRASRPADMARADTCRLVAGGVELRFAKGAR